MVDYTSSGWTDRGFGSTATQKNDQSLTPSGTRVTQAMSELMDRGYTQQQAAGIVGNWMAESGPNLNPQAVQGINQSTYQPAGTAQDVMNGLAASKAGYGLSQTTDPSRKSYMASALQGYAPYGGFTAALNASADEISDGYPGFASSTNLAGSTQYGLRSYEAPANQGAGALGQRMGFARTALGLAPAEESSTSGFYSPGAQDFGVNNPVDAYGNASYGRAPVGPVDFGGALPDISSASLGSTYGTISSDQPGAPHTADVSPTSFGMGFTPQTPAMDKYGLQMSDRFKSMDIAPEATPQVGDYSQEGGFHAAKPNNDFSEEPAQSKPSFGMNVSPTSFSGMKTTPMAPATSLAQALEPSYSPTYDGTVPKSPTEDPYGMPSAPEQTASVAPRSPTFAANPYALSMPTAASFAPAAFATATKAVQAPQKAPEQQFSDWGQQNNVTGNWAQDTSAAASNARISGLGAFTMDPLTGQMMATGNTPDRPEGFHETNQGDRGYNEPGTGPSGPTGGLW